MKSCNFEIDGKQVGSTAKTFVIAEVAQAHDGSLGTAYAYIDAAAFVGVDAIKFQTHIADAESTLDDKFRINFSKQDATRFDYWKRMEFSKSQWQELADYSRKKGLVFLSSAFSLEAIELLDDIGMAAWKIASGEIASHGILDRIALTNKPILVSTGMSGYKEIDQIVEKINEKGISYALMQCTSKYPTPLGEVGLNVLDEFKQRYNCCTGLSDHSGTIYPGMASISLGANILELHVTFDKRLFGPDVVASVTFDDLKILLEFRDAFYEMNSNPVNKDCLAYELKDMRNLFLKSIALKYDLKAGAILTKEMLTTKKPGTGISPDEMNLVLGRKLKNNVGRNKLLKWNDLND